ncbi:MAG: hypothetical protein IPG76_08870 [Acidobacteria bacterium]|nr:hypothetical protein [Acidobacteriota bacterium]
MSTLQPHIDVGLAPQSAQCRNDTVNVIARPDLAFTKTDDLIRSCGQAVRDHCHR